MDESEFLLAVQAAPDDDAPRLVWADWLEEHGDPRGELIRAQCELARMTEYSRRLSDLEAIESRLLREHHDVWLRPLREMGAKDVELWRGFVEQIEIRAADLLQHVDDIFAEAPLLRGLKISQVGGWMHDLSNLVQLEQIELLNLQFNRLGDSGVTRLTDSPHIHGLRHLQLSGNMLSERGVLQLSSTMRLAKLVSLELSFNRFGDAGASYLLYSPALRSLQSLDLRNTDISRPMIGELRRRFGTQVLT
jgi:uncharacterized protein (TIGR02996 family)